MSAKDKPITDDQLLLKYKNCGLPTARIAQKLGWTEAKVEERWREILVAGEKALHTKYPEFVGHCQNLTTLYQLMGQQLVIVSNALLNLMPDSEIKDLLVGDNVDVEATLKNLRANCIVLRPFLAPDPALLLQEHQQAQPPSVDPAKN